MKKHPILFQWLATSLGSLASGLTWLVPIASIAAEPPALAAPSAASSPSLTHEALSDKSDTRPLAVIVDQPPPPPLPDQPRPAAGESGAVWIEGYWNWQPAIGQFAWVSGVWKVPPPGRFWVGGYWKREEKGWTRVPGFWSDRKRDVLRDGPPREQPEETVGPAPGPDYFFVPGQYVPADKGTTIWRPGFWARARSGWEWVPALGPQSKWLGLSRGTLGNGPGRG